MTPRQNEAENAPVAAVWDRLLILVAIIGAALAIVAAVVAIRGGGVAAAAESDEQTGSLTLSEFAIEGDLDFAPGPVMLEVANDGSQVHNLTVEGGPATPDLSGGESASLDLGDLSSGTYVVFCSIAGHREAGMEASLVVTGGATTDTTMAHEGTDADWAELDRLMTESILSFPAETEGKGNQLLEPEILADGTKEFHLTAAITEWEVAPRRGGRCLDL